MNSADKLTSLSNPNSVISSLKTLLFSNNFSDFTIVLNESNCRIPAHSQLLACSSPYFASLLFGPFVEGSTKELHLSDIDKDTFCALLKFIYTGESEISLTTLPKLIEASQRLCIVEAISIFTSSAQKMIEELDESGESIDIVTKLLNESFYLKIDSVCEMCLDYIDLNTQRYLESAQFLELEAEVVEVILARDTLYDGLPEVSLYLACLKWARGFGSLDPECPENYCVDKIEESQLPSLAQLIQCIRLPLIEARYIVNKIDKSNLFTQEALYEAISYRASPESYLSDNRLPFRERKGSKKPWDWSEEKIGPHILLSSDRRLAIAHHYDWEKVLGKTVWYAGIHSFKVYLDLNINATSNSWQIIVGLSNPNTPLTDHLGSGIKEWGLACYSGHKISNCDKREEYTSGSKKGDIIEVKVDLGLKQLEFLRNNKSLGVAFHNVCAPVSPAVSLLRGQRVKLIWD